MLIAAMLVTTLGADMLIKPGLQTECQATIQYCEDGQQTEATVPFLLFVPVGCGADGASWPLLLFLHGLGESGTGQLDKVKIHGPAGRVDKDPDFPFILVSPQCPPPPEDAYRTAWSAPQLAALLDHVSAEIMVDARRVYVTGLSMGGFGTWRLAALYPDRFAAIAPICGGGKLQYAVALKDVPIWSFHGAKDTVVPVEESQQMVDAINRLGGKAKLTVYPDVEHNSWQPAYSNPELYRWLLSQQKRES
jgi:predicted peptidase